MLAVEGQFAEALAGEPAYAPVGLLADANVVTIDDHCRSRHDLARTAEVLEDGGAVDVDLHPLELLWHLVEADQFARWRGRDNRDRER